MTHTITCDFCNKTAPIATLAGWWVVEGLHRVGEQTQAYHYCDSTCLTAGVQQITRRKDTAILYPDLKAAD